MSPSPLCFRYVDKALDALGTLKIQVIQYLDPTIGLHTLHMLQCVDWLNCEHLVMELKGWLCPNVNMEIEIKQLIGHVFLLQSWIGGCTQLLPLLPACHPAPCTAATHSYKATCLHTIEKC